MCVDIVQGQVCVVCPPSQLDFSSNYLFFVINIFVVVIVLGHNTLYLSLSSVRHTLLPWSRLGNTLLYLHFRSVLVTTWAHMYTNCNHPPHTTPHTLSPFLFMFCCNQRRAGEAVVVVCLFVPLSPLPGPARFVSAACPSVQLSHRNLFYIFVGWNI